MLRHVGHTALVSYPLHANHAISMHTLLEDHVIQRFITWYVELKSPFKTRRSHWQLSFTSREPLTTLVYLSSRALLQGMVLMTSHVGKYPVC